MSDQLYERAWTDYRMRRRALWMVPLGLLLLSWGIHSVSANAPLALFVSAMVAYVALLKWSESWSCPRCGKKFLAKNGNGRECAHCGLRKWAGSSFEKPGLQKPGF